MVNSYLNLRRACIYSLPACKRGTCSPENKENKIDAITNFIISPTKNKIEEIRSVLSQFPFASIYYRLIAQKHQIGDIFNPSVIEAYWIGNNLLDIFFKEKIKNIPLHNSDILVVAPTEDTRFANLALCDLCRISWGQVQQLLPDDNKVVIQYNKLEESSESIFIISNRLTVDEFRWNKSFVPELQVGDWVSLHYGEVVEKLSQKQKNNLINYTEKCVHVAR